MNTDPGFIGNINPYRYRGYYFDTETGLYYCNTRYYDPEVGRWINADDVAYLDPETIGGLNLYSYCLNNPISYYDPTGRFPILIALILGAGLLIGGSIGGKVAYDNAVSAGKTGTDLFWSTIGGVALGGAVGIAGAGLLMAGGAAIYAGGAYLISGTVGITIAGIAATKVVAIGLLAYNIFAAVVAPLVGLTIELVEWGGAPYQPPKPGGTPRHPSKRKSTLLPINFLRNKYNLLKSILWHENKFYIRSSIFYD